MKLRLINTASAIKDVMRVLDPKFKVAIVDLYIKRAEALVNNEGRGGVVILKSCYQIATKVALGYTFEPLSFRKSNKIGFPDLIKELYPYLISENPEMKRIGLSIARLYTSFYTSPDYSTLSIEDKGMKATPYFKIDMFSKFLDHWSQKFKYKTDKWYTDQLHSSTKAGPNGPAMISSHIDAIALTQNKVTWEAFKTFCKESNKDNLIDFVEKLVDSTGPIQTKVLKLGSLAFLPEGGGKTRVIAIGDYWTNEALNSLHKQCLKWLAQLTTDGTHDQNRIAFLAKEFGKSGHPAYCFDLKSATDRFPVWIQEGLLGKIIGIKAASAWTTMLTHRGYTLAKEQRDVIYSRGQPMGLYTSWPVFALCHHALVEYAAARCHLWAFRDYVMIGDDIVIFNKKVATVYELLLESLDVPISKDKSIISTEKPIKTEIAKRLFIGGVEISPVPYDIIAKASTNLGLYPMLVNVLHYRGVSFHKNEAGTLMSKWFSSKKTVSSSFLPLLGIPENFPGHIKWPLEFPLPSEILSPEINRVRSEIDVWLATDLEAFHEVYSSERIKSLTKRQDSMLEYHDSLSMIEDSEGIISSHYSARMAKMAQFMIKGGIPIPNLDTKQDLGDGFMSRHPWRHIAVMDFERLGAINARIQHSVYGDPLTLDPKEYIPDLGHRKYFRTRHEQRLLYTANLMLKSLATLNKGTEKP